MSLKEKFLENNIDLVGDTADFKLIEELKPTDATTNPTLVLQVIKKEEFKYLIPEAKEHTHKYIEEHSEDCKNLKQVLGLEDESFKTALVADFLIVLIGKLIYDKVPGYVSTEVDAAYSFDTIKSVAQARHILKLYKYINVDTSRILIKLGSTYEGIRACKELQDSGVNCNMTLVFSWEQALNCHHAGAFLISPFVNRFKVYKLKEDADYKHHYGCQRAYHIANLYGQMNSKTIIMYASLKKMDELNILMSIDRKIREKYPEFKTKCKMTISPDALREMSTSPFTDYDPVSDEVYTLPEYITTELSKDELNSHLDAIPVVKKILQEGIANFEKDGAELKKIIS